MKSAARSGVRVASGMRPQYSRVPCRISWLVTVGLCLIAALPLLIEGYVGYFGVLLAVAPAASC